MHLCLISMYFISRLLRHIKNPQNKINLCDFLSSSLCKIGQERLMQGKRLVIAGGFTDGERVVEITRARPTEDIDALKSNHEEADTRMILHAAYAVRDSPIPAIVIQSPDTDVLVLCVSHFTALDATSYGSAQVLVIARGIFQHIQYKKSEEKDCASLFQHFMPSLAAIRQAAYLVAGRRNHGLPCRAAPPTRQLLACLDSSQTWMRSLLKAPRLSFGIYTPRHEDKRISWTR